MIQHALNLCCSPSWIFGIFRLQVACILLHSHLKKRGRRGIMARTRTCLRYFWAQCRNKFVVLLRVLLYWKFKRDHLWIYISNRIWKKTMKHNQFFLYPKTMRPHVTARFSIDLTGPGRDLGPQWNQRRLDLIQTPKFRGETSVFRQPTLTTNTGISVIRVRESTNWNIQEQ
jgi:hypothetical protein